MGKNVDCLLKGGGLGDVRVVPVSLAVGLSKTPHSPSFTVVLETKPSFYALLYW